MPVRVLIFCRLFGFDAQVTLLRNPWIASTVRNQDGSRKMILFDQARGEPYLGFSYPEGMAYESPGLLRSAGLPRVINQTRE